MIDGCEGSVGIQEASNIRCVSFVGKSSIKKWNEAACKYKEDSK